MNINKVQFCHIECKKGTAYKFYTMKYDPILSKINISSGRIDGTFVLTQTRDVRSPEHAAVMIRGICNKKITKGGYSLFELY